MAAFTVERTDSPIDALAAARAHLATDPIRHNVVLTLLHNRAAHPEPGRPIGRRPSPLDASRAPCRSERVPPSPATHKIRTVMR